jgi:hypothetical protein
MGHLGMAHGHVTGESWYIHSPACRVFVAVGCVGCRLHCSSQDNAQGPCTCRGITTRCTGKRTSQPGSRPSSVRTSNCAVPGEDIASGVASVAGASTVPGVLARVQLGRQLGTCVLDGGSHIPCCCAGCLCVVDTASRFRGSFGAAWQRSSAWRIRSADRFCPGWLRGWNCDVSSSSSVTLTLVHQTGDMGNDQGLRGCGLGAHGLVGTCCPDRSHSDTMIVSFAHVEALGRAKVAGPQAADVDQQFLHDHGRIHHPDFQRVIAWCRNGVAGSSVVRVVTH